MDIDLQVRLAAFNWLSEQVNSHGDVLLRKLLEQGFEFQGQRIPLVAPPLLLNIHKQVFHTK